MRDYLLYLVVGWLFDTPARTFSNFKYINTLSASAVPAL
eukprot:SAG31_NODE_44452_length_262_cov_2.521472_1_plen_38_part_10